MVIRPRAVPTGAARTWDNDIRCLTSQVCHMTYLVGSVVYWRPDGVVHRNVPSGS
jgi:hypothetical protein